MSTDTTRVVLVHPDPDVEHQLRELLSAHGPAYVVSTASSLGAIGVATECDVIVAAHEAAAADFEALRRVRRELPSTPVILLARDTLTSSAAESAVYAGADDIVEVTDLDAGRLDRVLRVAVARRAAEEAEHVLPSLLAAGAPASDEGERLRQLIDVTELGSFDLDVRTGHLHWSDRTRRFFGVSADEPVSYDTFLKGLHQQDRPRVHAAVQAALQGENGGRYAGEFRTVAPDGHERWLASWGRVISDEGGGEARRFIGVMLDITERKRAEQALVEADRRRSEFLATLAHELRNPLAPIRFAVTMLQPLLDADSAGTRPLAVIDRQVAHLSRLIDDLLDVSRITTNKIQLRLDATYLADILRAAVEATEPLIEAAGHQLEVHIPQAPVALRADAARLVQVFSNLLNNASKFTPPGGTIRLTVLRAGDDVRVSVADDGMGIAPEVLPHVFDLFRQEDVTLERSAGGLGIGLTLAKTLVTMHEGTIEARSAGPGAGAEFIVQLPVSANVPAERGEAVEVQPEAGASLRVLIVDDNTDAAEMLALFTRELGHETSVAFEGYTAVRTAADFRPDLVLLDIGMPGLNGYSVARMLRQRKVATRMFIVAVTGWGQEDDRRRARDAGFDLHLTKPVDPDELSRLFDRISHTRGCSGCEQCLPPFGGGPRD